MAVVSLRYLDTPPDLFRRGVVTIGNFDGVHRGHAALIATAREMADRTGGPVVPITFAPHPMSLLAPDRFQPPLTTPEERASRLLEAGADHVVLLQTTPELLALSPEYFFETILAGALQAKGIVEGFNFRFGHQRAGSNATLASLSEEYGIQFREVAAFEWEGRTVSSSRVRDALLAGNVAEANSLLCRPYRLTGIVSTGMKRGRTIGFPTANLEHIETLVPAEGVYAVRATANGQVYWGAANIGPNPTFGEMTRKIEVHLLDYAGDLYGQSLEVEFRERLRSTRPFANVDELVQQLHADVAAVRRLKETT
jgi:riboflavin kinase/FMN adenylyltransferase